MRRRVAVVLFAVIVGFALEARADLLRVIDARHAGGTIDAETRHYYRVAALKDRGRLPLDLRLLPLESGRRSEATRVMVEAFQWVMRHEAHGGRLQRLLAPPPDMMQVLDSSTLPIRVTYASSARQGLAQAILDAAEQSWTIMTESYGFYTPAIEPGMERYRIYIDDANGAAAYTAPYAEDPTTPRSDCYSYIVYDPGNPAYATLSTVAHELNHAMQSAMDCTESVAFMENTATYAELGIDDRAWEFVYWTMDVFQSYPWRALDYMEYGNSDGYEYGGVLWPIYLTSTFAPTDGPVFMRKVWEACIQDDRRNSKDYLQAVAEVVAAGGGPDRLEPVFADFSESRYFVGVDSDGAHIPNAASFARCEVAPVARRTVQELPIVGATPTLDRRPAPFGSNHVVLTLGGSYPHRLRVTFDGADETRWEVRALLVGGGATESLPLTLDPSSWQGTLEVDPAGRTKLVLVVANLGTDGYSPNDMDWTTAEFAYGIEPLPAAPTLTALVPAEVERGAVGVTMKLQGRGFVRGPDFAVAFDDPTLFVASVTSVADAEVKFVLTVPAETPLGAKSVIVTNAGGAQAVGTALLTVVAPPEGGGTGGAGDGCGCASARGRAPGALLVLLVLASPLVRRRRA